MSLPLSPQNQCILEELHAVTCKYGKVQDMTNKTMRKMNVISISRKRRRCGSIEEKSGAKQRSLVSLGFLSCPFDRNEPGALRLLYTCVAICHSCHDFECLSVFFYGIQQTITVKSLKGCYPLDHLRGYLLVYPTLK